MSYVVAAVLPTKRLTIDDISSLGLLRAVWNNTKQSYWTVRLSDFVLWHDPIDYLQWAIDPRPHPERLRLTLIRGSYRPNSPVFVRLTLPATSSPRAGQFSSPRRMQAETTSSLYSLTSAPILARRRKGWHGSDAQLVLAGFLLLQRLAGRLPVRNPDGVSEG
jgi:hypothetical protein